MSYYVDPWLFNCTDNPADSPDRPARAADDHHRRPARARLRAPQRRDARLGGGQRRHRLHEDAHRRLEPRLRERARRSAVRTRSRPVVCEHAVRGQPCDLRCRRPARARASRTTRTTATGTSTSPRRVATRTTRPTEPATSAASCSPRIPESVARALGDIDENGDPTNEFVIKNCSGVDLRVLPVPAGHVDGVPARGRCRRADRVEVRTASGRASSASTRRSPRRD